MVYLTNVSEINWEGRLVAAILNLYFHKLLQRPKASMRPLEGSNCLLGIRLPRG